MTSSRDKDSTGPATVGFYGFAVDPFDGADRRKCRLCFDERAERDDGIPGMRQVRVVWLTVTGDQAAMSLECKRRNWEHPIQPPTAEETLDTDAGQ